MNTVFGYFAREGLIAGLLAAAVSLPAQTVSPMRQEGRDWVQVEEGSLPSGGRLRIAAIGKIRVQGEDSRQVRYRVTKKVRGDQAEAARWFEESRLAATRQGTAAVLSLKHPGCGRCGFSVEMEVYAPFSTSETIVSTQGGELKIGGVSGHVVADSAGGVMEFDAIGGSVRANSAGGNITLGQIGGSVLSETAGGSISVRQTRGDAVLTTSGGGITAGEIGGSLRAETAGGSIRAGSVKGKVFAGTSGGSIELGRVEGEVRAETAGGSIQVASAPRGARVETASGDIRLEGVAGTIYAASAAGSIRAVLLGGTLLSNSLLETHAGTIVVLIPDGLALTIDAAVDLANSLSRIESDFSSVRVARREEGFGPNSVVAVGAINGGGPTLRIRNTNGRIQIRRISE